MKEVAKNVYQIGLGMVNAFVIVDDGLTLIDTGNKGSMGKIFSALEKNGKNPNDIKRIVLTHCHPDHAGSAAEIQKRLNIPVWAHPEDAKLIEKGIAGRKPMILSPGVANWIIYNLFIKNTGNTIEPVKVDKLLNDNDIILVAGGVRVIHTPGHCAGHIALLVQNEGLLIAGDICANAMGLDLSAVYENREVGVQSILKAVSFSFDKAVFGHGNLLKSNASTKIKEKFNT